MISKIRTLKNKKGFTLVELIVVLVILAILAALLIPALTGYIDQANKEKVVGETRMVAMAVQTEASEAYGLEVNGSLNDDKTKTKEWKNGESTADAHITSIVDLAEVIDLTNTTFQATISTSGEVVEVKYNNGSYTCTYTASDKNYVTVKSSDKLTNVVTIQKAA